MIRKLKALGLACVAVLAFGALSATAASAASFHSEASHTILDGAQPVATDDVFTFKAGTVKCNAITYTGTTTSATTGAVTVSPTFSDCIVFGLKGSASSNGCTFTFNATNDDLLISCPANNTIVFTGFSCRVKLGAQTISSGISYDTAGSGTSRDITTTANISGLQYTQEHKAFPNCSGGAGTSTDGTYRGSATFTGRTTTGSAVGIWHTA